MAEKYENPLIAQAVKAALLLKDKIPVLEQNLKDSQWESSNEVFRGGGNGKIRYSHIIMRLHYIAATTISFSNVKKSYLSSSLTLTHLARTINELLNIVNQLHHSSQMENLFQRIHALTEEIITDHLHPCLLYTSPSPRDLSTSRMPSSA